MLGPGVSTSTSAARANQASSAAVSIQMPFRFERDEAARRVQRGAEIGRALRDGHARQADGVVGRRAAASGRGCAACSDCQRDARRSRHGRRAGCTVAPLDQRGQRAVEQPLAVVAHGDLPAAAGRAASCARPRSTSPRSMPSAGQRVARPRSRRARWRRSAPAAARRCATRGCSSGSSRSNQRAGRRRAWAWLRRVDRDDLEVGARKGRRGDAQQPVVRAHQRVLAARAGRDAQRALRTSARPRPGWRPRRPGGRLRAAWRRCSAASPLPSMQVTESPPTQTWPVGVALDTCTRPARPRHGALRCDVAVGRVAVGDQPLRQAGVQAAGDRVFVDADGRGEGAHFEGGATLGRASAAKARASRLERAIKRRASPARG